MLLHYILQRLHMTPDEYAKKPSLVRMFIRASMRAQIELENRDRT